MTTVHLGERRLSDYAPLLSLGELTSLRQIAGPLAGLRVLHISAAPFGSAVTETLAALVPLQRDLGLRAEWRLLGGGRGRWATIYEGLRGQPVTWDSTAERDWQAEIAGQATASTAGFDLVVVHDPQALALVNAPGRPVGQPWIWHCHLDTRRADAAVWQSVVRILRSYAAVAFPDESLLRPEVPTRCSVLRPAIDPGARQHQALPDDRARQITRRLGIDPLRPLLGQFSPLSAAYAPLAALGSYWLTRASIPGLQLVLADDACDARSNGEDGELARIRQAAGNDTDIHVFAADAGLTAVEINALRQQTDLALQLAIPAGFGWSVAACQWKGVPVVAGSHGMLPQQVGDANIAYAGAPDAAGIAVDLLGHPDKAAAIGRAGYEGVRERHLIPHVLADSLRLFRRVTRTDMASTAAR